MAVELSRQVIDSVLQGIALMTLAWIRHALGQDEGAVAAMDEAYRLLPATSVSMVYPGEALRSRLLLALGRTSEAARWTELRGLTDHDEITYPRERDHLVLAQVLLARNDAGRAVRLLERLDALAEALGRTEHLIEARALRALAMHAAGDHQGALATLADALALAQPEGYVRVFADEGPPMAALLQSLIRARRRGSAVAVSQVTRAHVDEIVRAFAPVEAGPETAVAATATLIDPLTRRETEVLDLIAAGKRNQEIADELVVTLDTVKKHVSHIFDKLGANSRGAAVARARDLGLVP